MISKKTTIITFLILLLILALAGCKNVKPQIEEQENTPKTPTGAVVILDRVQETTQEKEELPLAPIQKTEEPPITKAEVPLAPIESKILIEKSRKFSPELRDLLQKADRTVKSISYVYSISPGNEGFDKYLIKGTKMKILLFEKNEYNIENYFNAVYLDATTKQAKGKCENKQRCLTKIADNTKKIYDLNYDDYITKTPYEWLKEIEYAEIVGMETIDHRTVTKIRIDHNNEITEMWIDNGFGIPHRIKITTKDGQETTHYFKNLQFNTLKDTDVTLRTI